MSLQEYRRKRDFKRTAEPQTSGGDKRGAKAQHRFVIQKHAASHLHYDFRLEVGGTLKSWAVPKGPPYKQGEKRLAMQVEDHPLGYREFEGTIPKGEYGGGTVMVWDLGTFEGLGSKSPGKDLEEGKLHFELHGTKLKGEWTLVRMHGSEKEWLLIKSGADMKAVSKKDDDSSALSGRGMAEIGKAVGAVWHSKPAGKSAAVTESKLAAKIKVAAKSKRGAKLHFIQPMKATQVAGPPAGDDWRYELKFDGYRALAVKDADGVRLFSSNGKDFNARFPDIVRGVSELSGRELILDGEIVALDSRGHPSFQKLQAYALGEEEPVLAYYVFDLLREDGRDLTKTPWIERRERLEELMKSAEEPVRFSATLGADVGKLLTEVSKLGLEGLIGKREGSIYEAGRRSAAWVKIKCLHEQEFVIGGYTPPGGTRKHLGALLIGYYEKKKLLYAGKVGTGFDYAVLRMLHDELKGLGREECPFTNLPETKSSRWSPTLTAREMALCHWAKPALVAQIRFTEWTDEGKLRHPVFLGLREDKMAREVRREGPVK